MKDRPQKRPLGFGFSLMLLATLLCMPAAGAQAAGTCIRPVVVGWPVAEVVQQSYADYDADLKVAVDTATEAGCDYVVRYEPWPRLLNSLADGSVQVLPLASYAKERTVFAVYSRPYKQTPVHLAYAADRQGHFDALDWAGHVAQKLTFAKTIRQSLGEKLDTRLVTSGLADYLVEVNSMDQAVAMLLRDRIDGIVGPKGRLAGAIANAGKDGAILVSEDAIGQDSYHLLFSKTGLDAAERDALDAALGRLLRAQNGL